jgi:hypothetical protein
LEKLPSGSEKLLRVFENPSRGFEKPFGEAAAGSEKLLRVFENPSRGFEKPF